MMRDGHILKGLTSTAIVVVASQAYGADIVELDRPYVAIGDVIYVSSPPTERLAPALDEILSLPLFSLEAGQVTTISVDDLETHILNRVPGLQGRIERQSLASQSFRYSPKNQSADGSTCIVVAVPINADEAILQNHVRSSTQCGSNMAAVRYDHGKRIYKSESKLSVGQRLPVRSLSVIAAIQSGEERVLSSRVGPVEIQRPVTILSPVYRSGPTQVQTSDGQVVIADVQLGEPSQ